LGGALNLYFNANWNVMHREIRAMTMQGNEYIGRALATGR
jgi:hypothetical protein